MSDTNKEHATDLVDQLANDLLSKMPPDPNLVSQLCDSLSHCRLTLRDFPDVDMIRDYFADLATAELDALRNRKFQRCAQSGECLTITFIEDYLQLANLTHIELGTSESELYGFKQEAKQAFQKTSVCASAA